MAVRTAPVFGATASTTAPLPVPVAPLATATNVLSVDAGKTLMIGGDAIETPKIENA